MLRAKARCATPAAMVLIVLACDAGRAGAAFVVLTPSSSLTATTTQGGSGPGTTTYSAGARVADVTAQGPGRGPQQTYRSTATVLFDLAAIPAGSAITSASLVFVPIYQYPAFAIGGPLLSVSSGGSPSTTATPPNQGGPTTDVTTAFASLPGYRPGDPFPTATLIVDETATLRAILGRSAALAASFSIAFPSSSVFADYVLESPRLEVTFEPAAVPEPGSLTLVGIAAAGLGVWARRRRAA